MENFGTIAAIPTVGIEQNNAKGQEQSVTPTSINSLLCRWRKLNRIDKTADGHWKRLK